MPYAYPLVSLSIAGALVTTLIRMQGLANRQQLLEPRQLEPNLKAKAAKKATNIGCASPATAFDHSMYATVGRLIVWMGRTKMLLGHGSCRAAELSAKLV